MKMNAAFHIYNACYPFFVTKIVDLHLDCCTNREIASKAFYKVRSKECNRGDHCSHFL